MAEHADQAGAAAAEVRAVPRFQPTMPSVGLPRRSPQHALREVTRVRPARLTVTADTAALPDRWTDNVATIAATLAALKADSDVPETTVTTDPASNTGFCALTSAPPEAAAPTTLPTRASRREAAQRTQAAGSHRGRLGLFARVLTVRAFRSHKSVAKAGPGPVDAVGELLHASCEYGVHTLHRRRVPGQRGLVEYLAVTASGVYVIDVKHHKNALIELRPTAGDNTPSDLLVGGRLMTAAASATARRASAVRAALDADGRQAVPVVAALCFIDGVLPLGLPDLQLHGTHILGQNTLAALVRAKGPLDSTLGASLQLYLSEEFPPHS